jgi:hypothetical protein
VDERDVIAEGVLACKSLVGRYLAGFDDSNRTRQAPGLPNHVAWSLGHCALTMHRAAEKIDAAPPPASDFLIGEPRGDATRFGTESVCFGSTPTDDAGAYPTTARCIIIFGGACDRLAAAVRDMTAAQLDETIRWGAGETTLRTLALRMIFHNGTHAGQIADLRRALGFTSIFR